MPSSLLRRALLLASACACLLSGLAPTAAAQDEEPVPLADLTVTKSAAEATAPDADISYSIVIANNGPDAAVGATLTDPLPAGTTFESLTQTSGPDFSCTTPEVGDGGTVTCDVATLAAGAQAEFTLVVHTDPDSPPGTTFTNVATASSSTFDPNEENDAGVATSTVPAVQADMRIAVQAPESSLPGADLTYTVELANGGPDAADASWQDTLPGTATFVALEQTSGPAFACTTPAVGAGGTVSCSVASLPAGAAATFTLVVHIPSDTPSGTVFTNTASIATTANDPTSVNDSSTTSTTINDADVGVAITGPAAATAGDTLTYTLTVTNAGPDPATSVSVVDALPAELTFVSFTQDSGPAFARSSPAAGTNGTVTATREVFGSGQTATFTLVVQVDPATPTRTVTNTVTVSAFEADRDPTDNTASVSTAVTELPPPAPSALASVPGSPANDNAPRITGAAQAGSTVRVYATADCTGTPAATGSAADFAEPGLAVTVADDSTTTFRATATNTGGTSPCSTSSVTYEERSPSPASPAPPRSPASPASPESPASPASPGAAPPEPGAMTRIAPWRLVRAAAPRTTRRNGRVRVSTGYVAVCPAGGPDCTGRVTLKVFRRSSRGGLLRIFLHGRTVTRTIPAGTEQRIVFHLNARGRRLLRRAGTLTTVLRGSIRSGGEAPVVRSVRLRIASPRRR